MCGISGFVDNSISEEKANSLLPEMIKSLNHRGPDNSGNWINLPVGLGHNRLSIIDLTTDANQPMHLDNLVITYNGEIYNYLEIRETLLKKGYQFKTQSDTEVILISYKEWGSDCVKQFIGMWAFAIWDKMKKELFCSRDRFGIKPFHYIFQNGNFYFSSEYKALKLSPYLKIKNLPPAHYLILKDGEINIHKYWDIDLNNKSQISFDSNKIRFREMFLDAIKLQALQDLERN